MDRSDYPSSVLTVSSQDRAVLRQIAFPFSVFASWAVLLFATPADRIFGDGELFLWGLIPGVAASAFYLRRIPRALRGLSHGRIKAAVAMTFGILFAFLPAGFVALCAVNCWFDPGRPSVQGVQVLGKEIVRTGSGKRRTVRHELKVRDWRGDWQGRPEPLTLTVSPFLHGQAKPGATELTLQIRPGLLGYAWIVKGSMHIEPQIDAIKRDLASP